MVNQLIIEGILLPYTRKDRYSCWEEPLTRQVDMISGRRAVEVIGTKFKVWKISWSYDYMGNDLLRQILAVLRSGKPFLVSALPDISDVMFTSTFLLESMTQPTYAFDRNGVGLWHNVSFALREERPH